MKGGFVSVIWIYTEVLIRNGSFNSKLLTSIADVDVILPLVQGHYSYG